jgi:hypothetical protein
MTLIDLEPLACPIHTRSAAIGHVRVQNLMGGTSCKSCFGHKTVQPCPLVKERGCSELFGISHKGPVDSVNTFGVGLGRTSAGLGRIAYVFWSSQYLRAPECGSSPSSGTRFPLGWGPFRGLQPRGHCPHPVNGTVLTACRRVLI